MFHIQSSVSFIKIPMSFLSKNLDKTIELIGIFICREWADIAQTNKYVSDKQSVAIYSQFHHKMLDTPS